MNEKQVKKSKLNSKLTAKEIQLILRACAQAKVSVFRYRGLEVAFHSGEKPIPESRLTPPVIADQSQQQPYSDQKLHPLVEEELAIREEQIANMRIDDPVQFEKLMAQGEFVDQAPKGTLNDEDEILHD